MKIVRLFKQIFAICMGFVQWCSRGLSGGQVTHPKSQNEEKSKKKLEKIRKIDKNLRKNEEGGILAHPDCEAGYSSGFVMKWPVS